MILNQDRILEEINQYFHIKTDEHATRCHVEPKARNYYRYGKVNDFTKFCFAILTTKNNIENSAYSHYNSAYFTAVLGRIMKP